MYIAMLGRQPALGMAELERTFRNVRWFSNDSALIESDSFDIQKLGGTVKAGQVIHLLQDCDWRKTSIELVRMYSQKWQSSQSKITVGISAYGFKISAKDVQRTAHILKTKLKEKGVNLRTVPNDQPALSSASSHHNRLGLSPTKIELMIVRGHSGKVIIAESTGAQNITALARRDQTRPSRDAFVGMLPPKLAQIMINLGAGELEIGNEDNKPIVLDPFCGTGVVLQEALLMGYKVYGTDLSQKMINYTAKNIDWLNSRSHFPFPSPKLEQGDATTYRWNPPIDAVVTETYLGQPFSTPPSAKKLAEVRQTCDTIISKFLANIAHQLASDTPLCVAIPAWNNGNDSFTRLPLIGKIEELGFRRIKFKNISSKDLIYYRPGQVVARELLVLEKF